MGELNNNDPSFVEKMMQAFIERNDVANTLKLMERIGAQISLDTALVLSNFLIKKNQLDPAIALVNYLPAGDVRDCIALQLAIYCLIANENNNVIYITQAVRQLGLISNQSLKLQLARRCFTVLVNRTWRSGNGNRYRERMPADFADLVLGIGQAIATTDQQSVSWFEQRLLEALQAGNFEIVWRIAQFLPVDRQHDVMAIVPQQ